jgi:hypothetical protein
MTLALLTVAVGVPTLLGLWLTRRRRREVEAAACAAASRYRGHAMDERRL